MSILNNAGHDPAQQPPAALPVSGEIGAWFAAHDAHHKACEIYNEWLTLARAERERGNRSMKLDTEYRAMNDADSAAMRANEVLYAALRHPQAPASGEVLQSIIDDMTAVATTEDDSAMPEWTASNRDQIDNWQSRLRALSPSQPASGEGEPCEKCGKAKVWLGGMGADVLMCRQCDGLPPLQPASEGAPFMSMADALGNPDFQRWADQLLDGKKHSLATATEYRLTNGAREIVREMLIEAIGIGVTKFDRIGQPSVEGKLREALEPFAHAAAGIPESVSDAKPYFTVSNDARCRGTITTITVADMRRAAIAILRSPVVKASSNEEAIVEKNGIDTPPRKSECHAPLEAGPARDQNLIDRAVSAALKAFRQESPRRNGGR